MGTRTSPSGRARVERRLGAYARARSASAAAPPLASAPWACPRAARASAR
jgi:hypothetical protein